MPLLPFDTDAAPPRALLLKFIYDLPARFPVSVFSLFQVFAPVECFKFILRSAMSNYNVKL